MRVIVEIMPKEGILDPQGQAIRHALHQLEYAEVGNVLVGKRIVVELDTKNRDEARLRVDEMARKLLHNENVERYRILIDEGEES